jgi:hypothetical protein
MHFVVRVQSLYWYSVQRVVHVITTGIITLNANLNTTNSGEGIPSARLADRKVVMDIREEIFGKASAQSWDVIMSKFGELTLY